MVAASCMSFTTSPPGSMGSDLLLELEPDDLDELAGPSGADPEPDT
jgi:hypothetical protein